MTGHGRPGATWPWWPVPQRLAWAVLMVTSVVGVLTPIAGLTWTAARASTPGTARYLTAMEDAWSMNEAALAVLVLLIVGIPLRRGERWAWWSVWVAVVAQAGYLALVGGQETPVLLRRLGLLLVTAIALIVLAPAALRPTGRD